MQKVGTDIQAFPLDNIVIYKPVVNLLSTYINNKSYIVHADEN